MLQTSLFDKLLRLINKTLVLELNVFKMQNKLNGATPEERFADFIQQLKTKKVRDYINRDYPILVRRITEEADNWLHHSFQFGRAINVVDLPIAISIPSNRAARARA